MDEAAATYHLARHVPTEPGEDLGVSPCVGDGVVLSKVRKRRD
jgi:hypothetical protein